MRRDSHLAHPLQAVCEIASIQTTRWIMVIAEHYGRGVEVEICWGDCLLPGLQGGHGVVAELVCESAYGIRRVVEGDGRIVIVVVWEDVRPVR